MFHYLEDQHAIAITAEEDEAYEEPELPTKSTQNGGKLQKK